MFALVCSAVDHGCIDLQWTWYLLRHKDMQLSRNEGVFCLYDPLFL